MVEDLKSHGLTEHPEPASPQIISFLDQQMEELFTPYLTGVAYIDREKKSLESFYMALLFNFTTYHVRNLDNLFSRQRANNRKETAEADDISVSARSYSADRSSIL